MLPFFWYMLKVIICSGILFAYYWLFLRNKIFHGYNRFYLLASMLLSLLLPLIKINFWQQATQANQAIRVLQAVSIGDDYMTNMVVTSQRSNWSLEQLYAMAYWFVSIIFLLVMLRSLFLIRTLLKQNTIQRIEDVAFVCTNHESTPFSFLKYIFWNSSIDINSTTGRQIFKHEVAHIQQKHTHDKLFVNIILIFCWCNPFFWLYRKELNMIHEFIADKKAVEDSDTAAFAAMILQAAYPKHRFELVNNFFYSPIKRRLLMLSKNKNPRVNYIGRIMVLPLAVLIFAAFTFKTKNSPSIYQGKKITVVIDAGHGGQDVGAKSTDGIFEKDLTLAIAKKVKELNSNDAIEIVLVRDGDVYMNPQQKVEFAKSKNADLVISFHVDNGPKELANTKTGISVLVAKNEFANAAESKILASAIINEFSNNYGLAVTTQPFQRQASVWILQGNTCPTVLIETGFLNNENDLAYLKTSTAKEAIAKNVLMGIEKYLINRPTNFAFQNNQDTIPELPPSDLAVLKTGTENIDTFNYYKAYGKSVSYKGQKIKAVFLRKTDNYMIVEFVNGKKLPMPQTEIFKADILSAPPPPPPPPPGFYKNDIRPDSFRNKGLVIVDGIIQSDNYIIGKDNIATVNVLKGKDATAKYGEKGEYGVIEIATLQKGVNSYNKTEPFIDLDTKLSKKSTLYIGIDNPIEFVSSIDKKELFWQISQGSLELKNGVLYAKVSAQGKVYITISKRDGSISPRSFTFNVSRVPDDPTDPNFPLSSPLVRLDRPIIKWGVTAGGRIEVDYFKAQKELTLSPGYSIQSATMWFAGPGFHPNITQVTLNSNSLSKAEKFINQCEDGTKIVIDWIKVKDQNGNIQSVTNPLILIIGFNNMIPGKPTEISGSNDLKIIDVTTSNAINKEKLNKNNDNKIFTQTETPTQFTGGQDAWLIFLRKNLKVNTPVDSGASAGKYKVVVKFIIHTDGTVSDITCENDPGFGTCAEVKRLIAESSKKWTPAIQNGIKVNSYHKQPVTFLVEE